MFSRLAILRPTLKCVYSRSGRVFLCDIRKFSDAAIDRELQESYAGIYPRLLVCGVIFFSYILWSSLNRIDVTLLPHFFTFYPYFQFRIQQDVMDPIKRDEIKKIMTDEIVSKGRPLTALTVYAGQFHLPSAIHTISRHNSKHYI
jgi:hypothetical protein